MATDSKHVTLNDIDVQLAGMVARLIEAAMQSAAHREPEQMAFLERLRAGDGLNLALVAVIPADDPSIIWMELALCRPNDGEPVARLLSISARKEGMPCDLH